MPTCQYRNCGETLSTNRMYCDAACCSAEWKLRKGYRDPRKSTKSLRKAAENARAVMERGLTDYVVLRIVGDELRYVGNASANKPEYAIRLVIGQRDRFRYTAIPATTWLRRFDGDGTR